MCSVPLGHRSRDQAAGGAAEGAVTIGAGRPQSAALFFTHMDRANELPALGGATRPFCSFVNRAMIRNFGWVEPLKLHGIID